LHIPAFNISGIPRIVFGAGTSSRLPALAAEFGTHALIITGAKSYTDTSHWPGLQADLKVRGLSVLHAVVKGEPSPVLVDALVNQCRNEDIDVVIGIGGGSVLDAAKAVANILKARL
jgi:alcohol dehydrogenase class IV